jgi:hypothetical protein
MMVLGVKQFTHLRRFGRTIRPRTYNQGTDMLEHVLLFCLLGLVFTVTIILVTAPGAVTWAVALIE